MLNMDRFWEVAITINILYPPDCVQVNTLIDLAADSKLVRWIGLKQNGENFAEKYVEFDVNYFVDMGPKERRKTFYFFF